MIGVTKYAFVVLFVVVPIVGLVMCWLAMKWHLRKYRVRTRTSRDSFDSLFDDLHEDLAPRSALRRTHGSRKNSRPPNRFDETSLEELFAEFEKSLRSQRQGYTNTTTHTSPQPWRVVLGVGADATLKDARDAFRRIAKETHPESVGAELANLVRFQAAVAAYNAAQREFGRA
jgi:hypothetical protein